MADIFVSYSQKDRGVAEELARFLDDCGYSVWWDYELVGGTRFRKEIEAQLQTAKAAIVIWTANSVESSFVLDEAQVAQSLGKLLPTRVPELAYAFIPLGFKQLQTDIITKPDLILRSLEEFGVVPSRPPVKRTAEPVAIAGGTVDPGAVAAADQIANWDYIKESASPADFSSYIERFPASPLAELARARLAKFEDEAWSVAEKSRDLGALRAVMAQFPGGRYEGIAKRIILSQERDAWNGIDKNDPAALRGFLAKFPDGLTADDIRARLADAEHSAADAQAWAALQAAPTRAGLDAYIAKYPFGAHVDEAKRAMSSVLRGEKRAARWAKIKDANFSEQLRAFIDEFESGPEVDEARARLTLRLREKEEASWATVKDTRHPAHVLRFLREHVGGARWAEANSLLASLPKTIETEAWAEVSSAQEPALLEAYLSAFPAGVHASEARSRKAATSGARTAPGAGSGFMASGGISGRSDIGASASGSAAPGARPSRGRLFGSLVLLLVSGGAYFGILGFIGELLSSAPAEGIAIVTAGAMVSALVLGRAIWQLLRRTSLFNRLSRDVRDALKYAVWVTPVFIWYALAQSSYRYQFYVNRTCPCPVSYDDGSVALGFAVGLSFVALVTGALSGGGKVRQKLVYIVPVIVGAIALLASVLLISNAGLFWTTMAMSNDTIMYGAIGIVLTTLSWFLARRRV